MSRVLTIPETNLADIASDAIDNLRDVNQPAQHLICNLAISVAARNLGITVNSFNALSLEQPGCDIYGTESNAFGMHMDQNVRGMPVRFARWLGGADGEKPIHVFLVLSIKYEGQRKHAILAWISKFGPKLSLFYCDSMYYRKSEIIGKNDVFPSAIDPENTNFRAKKTLNAYLTMMGGASVTKARRMSILHQDDVGSCAFISALSAAVAFKFSDPDQKFLLPQNKNAASSVIDLRMNIYKACCNSHNARFRENFSLGLPLLYETMLAEMFFKQYVCPYLPEEIRKVLCQLSFWRLDPNSPIFTAEEKKQSLIDKIISDETIVPFFPYFRYFLWDDSFTDADFYNLVLSHLSHLEYLSPSLGMKTLFNNMKVKTLKELFKSELFQNITPKIPWTASQVKKDEKDQFVYTPPSGPTKILVTVANICQVLSQSLQSTLDLESTQYIGVTNELLELAKMFFKPPEIEDDDYSDIEVTDLSELQNRLLDLRTASYDDQPSVLEMVEVLDEDDEDSTDYAQNGGSGSKMEEHVDSFFLFELSSTQYSKFRKRRNVKNVTSSLYVTLQRFSLPPIVRRSMKKPPGQRKNFNTNTTSYNDEEDDPDTDLFTQQKPAELMDDIFNELSKSLSLFSITSDKQISSGSPATFNFKYDSEKSYQNPYSNSKSSDTDTDFTDTQHPSFADSSASGESLKLHSKLSLKHSNKGFKQRITAPEVNPVSNIQSKSGAKKNSEPPRGNNIRDEHRKEQNFNVNDSSAMMNGELQQKTVRQNTSNNQECKISNHLETQTYIYQEGHYTELERNQRASICAQEKLAHNRVLRPRVKETPASGANESQPANKNSLQKSTNEAYISRTKCTNVEKSNICKQSFKKKILIKTKADAKSRHHRRTTQKRYANTGEVETLSTNNVSNKKKSHSKKVGHIRDEESDFSDVSDTDEDLRKITENFEKIFESDIAKSLKSSQRELRLVRRRLKTTVSQSEQKDPTLTNTQQNPDDESVEALSKTATDAPRRLLDERPKKCRPETQDALPPNPRELRATKRQKLFEGTSFNDQISTFFDAI